MINGFRVETAHQVGKNRNANRVDRPETEAVTAPKTGAGLIHFQEETQ